MKSEICWLELERNARQVPPKLAAAASVAHIVSAPLMPPRLPLWALLRATAMITPLGSAVPSKVEQVPCLQNCELEQLTPQAPQLLGSLERLTQLLPQEVFPPPHSDVQVLLSQYSAAVQLLEHAPQLLGSLVVSTQELPHLVVPAGHCNRQLPFEQTSPAAQGALQAPQLAASILVSTHVPLQSVGLRLGQTQLLLEQTKPLVQGLEQPPQ